MTEIEKKALALVNEVLKDFDHPTTYADITDAPEFAVHHALCRALEQHEAYKQEVSDAIEYFMDGPVGLGTARERLGRFIIPKPVDPLVEVLAEVTGQGENYTDERDADAFRTALAARGGRIVFDQPEGGAA